MNAVTDQMPTIPAPSAPTEAQQLLAIDPDQYVALVFEPFREKLARYKAEADAVQFDVSTPAGMKTAIEWRAKFRDELRIPAEAARKERKAPILEIGRLLDARAKALAQEIAPYEGRFDAAIQAEEEKRAALKRAKEEAERARVAEIQRRLAKLQTLPELYTSGLTPEKLAEVIRQLEGGLTFDYQEFAEAAEAARQIAITALRQAHVDALERMEQETRHRLAREAEQARLAAERKAQERIAQIRQRIVALNGPTHLTATDSPALIAQAMESVRNARIEYAEYGDLVAEALEARQAGADRLDALLTASRAHRAEQERLTMERGELERQQREQAERQAEIERRERQQRETEERQRREASEAEARRVAEARAEEERKAKALAREQAREQERRELNARIGSLTAEDIVRWIASELGCEWGPVAARIADIPHSEWVTLAATSEVTP